MMLVTYIPIIVIVIMYLTADRTPSQTDVMYAPLLGLGTAAQSPISALSLAVKSIQLGLPVFNVPSLIIMAVLVAWFAVTLGWQSVGTTYSLRSIIRGEPAFLFSDYFYAIKKNMKQAFFVGLIDFVIIAVLAFDIYSFYAMSSGFMSDIVFCILCGIAIIYLVMRFYIYLMLITFDLKISKLFKNALIFTALGIKRNLMALLGIVLVDIIALAMLFMITSVGIILPFVYYFALTTFMSAYAAYPVIKQYMIDPYYNEDGTEKSLIEEI